MAVVPNIDAILEAHPCSTWALLDSDLGAGGLSGETFTIDAVAAMYASMGALLNVSWDDPAPTANPVSQLNPHIEAHLLRIASGTQRLVSDESFVTLQA